MRADSLNEELRLEATLQPSGERVPLLEVLDPLTLRTAISNALPPEMRRPISAMYVDGDDGCTLCVRLCFSDVGFVHTLRDILLSGEFDANCTASLRQVPRDVRILTEGELRLSTDEERESASSPSSSTDPPPGQPQPGLLRGFFDRKKSQRKSLKPQPPVRFVTLSTRQLEWFDDGDDGMRTPLGSLALTADVSVELVGGAARPQLRVTSGDGETLLLSGKDNKSASQPNNLRRLIDWHDAIEERVAEIRTAELSKAVEEMEVVTEAEGAAKPMEVLPSTFTNDAARSYAAGRGQLQVVCDKTHFAEVYEASVLTLENLTPHQRDALSEVQQHEHVLLGGAGGRRQDLCCPRSHPRDFAPRRWEWTVLRGQLRCLCVLVCTALLLCVPMDLQARSQRGRARTRALTPLCPLRAV